MMVNIVFIHSSHVQRILDTLLMESKNKIDKCTGAVTQKLLREKCITVQTKQPTKGPTNQWTDRLGYHVKYKFNSTTPLGEYIRPESIG